MIICIICPSCNQSWCDGKKDDTMDEEKEEKENAKTDDSSDNRSANGTYTDKIATGLVIGGAVIAAPCIVASAAGFGTAEIAGSSVAAVWQSAIGNVAAGSTFATLQSLGATGVFVNGATVGTSAAGAGLATKVGKYVNDSGITTRLFRKTEDGPKSNKETPIVCPYCHAEFI